MSDNHKSSTEKRFGVKWTVSKAAKVRRLIQDKIQRYAYRFKTMRLARRMNPPIKLRFKTTDHWEFGQIFLNEGLSLPPSVSILPRLIIDAGAYIGLSARYYAGQYPEATILAVEPEASNFALLQRNTQGISQVSCLHAGLWHTDTQLRIGNLSSKTRKDAFFVEEASTPASDTMQAVTVYSLLKQSGFSHIDILKMDIEGSERAVFSKNYTEWIDKVNVLIVELHDSLYPGCSEPLYAALNKADWAEYHMEHEKAVFVRKEQLVHTAPLR